MDLSHGTVVIRKNSNSTSTKLEIDISLPAKQSINLFSLSTIENGNIISLFGTIWMNDYNNTQNIAMVITKKENRISEDEQAEKFFLSTIQRDITGWFVATFPFKKDSQIINRLKKAHRRLFMLETRLNTNPADRIKYLEEMKGGVNRGHFQETNINPNVSSNIHGFYFPHHAVWKKTDIV
jgi:hypothetical protein